MSDLYTILPTNENKRNPNAIIHHQASRVASWTNWHSLKDAASIIVCGSVLAPLTPPNHACQRHSIEEDISSFGFGSLVPRCTFSGTAKQYGHHFLENVF